MSDGDHHEGASGPTERRKRLRTGVRGTIGPPGALPPRVRLTPPCSCGYPLLNTDPVCPRCQKPRPRADA